MTDMSNANPATARAGTGLGLDGKRVVVTGAAGGLGRAFALGFAAAGAKLLVADIRPEGIDETVALIRASGGIAEAVTVDVTSAASCAALAEAARAAYGGADVLINNAAIYAGLERRPFEEIDEAVFDRADEFVIDRKPNPHVAFGFGIHNCLGAHLARLEGQIAVASMTRHFKSIRLAEGERPESGQLGGPDSLRVVIEPA